MRLLFVTGHTYLPDRVGGAESSIHELCLSLLERGGSVAVLARRAGADPAPQEDGELGYPVLRSPDPLAGVREALRRFAPQAAVVQSEQALALARACRDAGVPALVYLRDVQLHRLGGPLAAEPGLGFVANSRFTAKRIRETFGVTARVVPPLVRAERYRTPGQGSRVLFVNPVPVKGWEVARDLALARPDLPFDFVEAWPASGQRRARWRSELGHAANVRWHAPVHDMRPLYAGARVLLAPSLAVRGVWEEGFGRVVAEAHCSGIPVLASTSGALPESVGPGGILVDPEAGAEAWRAALARIVDEAETHAELSRAARTWAERPELQPDRLIADLLDAVAELTRTPQPSDPQAIQGANPAPIRAASARFPSR